MAIALLVPFGGAIANYDALLAQVQNFLDRDDMAADLPTYVALVESRVNRELRMPEMETVTDLTADSEYTDLPEDCLAVRSITIEGSPDRPLRALAPNAVPYNYNGSSGTPMAYIKVGKKIQLVPPPDSSVTLRLIYSARVDALSESNPRNWLLQYYPGVYLFGVLAYAAAAIPDQSALDRFLPAFEQEVADLKALEQRDRYGSGPLSPNFVNQVRGASC